MNEGLSNLDWPDGWFVFEHGVVKGPFSTKETFTEKTESKDCASFMVSRKGFGRWYSLNELAGVYKRGDHIGIANMVSVQDVESELSQAIQKLSQIRNQVKKSSRDSFKEIRNTDKEIADSSLSGSAIATKSTISHAPVKGKNLSPQVASHTETSSELGTNSERTGTLIRSARGEEKQEKNSQQNPRNSKKSKKSKELKAKLREQARANEENKANRKLNIDNAQLAKSLKEAQEEKTAKSDKLDNSDTSTGEPQLKKQSKKYKQPVRTTEGKVGTNTSHSSREIAYHHMMMAGRLRLGAINNPWTEAFAKFFAGFGIYWAIWVRKTAMATTMHLDGTVIHNSIRLFWLAMIPGYHMVMAHKLARTVLSMEKQNGYKTVSPVKAAWLAIFPPFAILYLQSALNRHWKLHVESEIRQKK